MAPSTKRHSSHIGSIQYDSNRHIGQKWWNDIISHKRPAMILDRLCYYKRRQRFVYRRRSCLYCRINRLRSKLKSTYGGS